MQTARQLAQLEIYSARVDRRWLWADTLRERFALARRELTATNRKIGDIDMLIAANVLSRGCTLVTNNEKDFKI